MAKKVSKFFRIGVEGDTCDGRVISAQDIQEMAETFDPRVYGCRINLEHLRGILPDGIFKGTVAKLAMRQPFVLFKGLTFQKLCLPGAFRPGDHHNKMLRPGLCVVHASPQYL